MASGLIGTVSGNGSLSYTPTSLTKVTISANSGNTASVTLNGTALPTNYQCFHWVGPNQTITITCIGGGGAILSALEG